jgi:hypothetical protein
MGGGELGTGFHTTIEITFDTGRYDVTFNGETVVKGSRDPETDFARALLAKGITGKVKVIDANTGKHRTTVNIEKAAKLRTVEAPHGPIFVKHSPLNQPYAGEDDLVLPTMPGDDDEAVA